MSKTTVLLVDDERELRNSIAQVLQADGWTVYEASSGPEAMSLWRTMEPKPGILVTDLRMETLNAGLVLGNWVKGEDPDCQVLIISGFLSGFETFPAGFKHMRKPLDFNELRKTLRIMAEGGEQRT